MASLINDRISLCLNAYAQQHLFTFHDKKTSCAVSLHVHRGVYIYRKVSLINPDLIMYRCRDDITPKFIPVPPEAILEIFY